MNSDKEQLFDITDMMSRQANLIGDTSDLEVLIIGVGGIGSNVADMMVSLGVTKIWLMDHDIVAPENEFPGNFRAMFTDMNKARAVSNDLVAKYSHGEHLEIYVLEDRIEDVEFDEEFWDIIVASTDSIDSRSYAFRTLQGNCNLWIDARMGGASATVFAVSPLNNTQSKFYRENELRPVIYPLPCGDKATAYLTSGFIAGMVGLVVRDVSTGKVPPYQQIFDGRSWRYTVVRD